MDKRKGRSEAVNARSGKSNRECRVGMARWPNNKMFEVHYSYAGPPSGRGTVASSTLKRQASWIVVCGVDFTFPRLPISIARCLIGQSILEQADVNILFDS